MDRRIKFEEILKIQGKIIYYKVKLLPTNKIFGDILNLNTLGIIISSVG